MLKSWIIIGRSNIVYELEISIEEQMRMGQFLRAVSLLQGPPMSTGGLRGWNAWLDDFITRFQLSFLMLLFRSPRAIAAEKREIPQREQKAWNIQTLRRAATRRIAFVSLPRFLPAHSFSHSHGDVIYSMSDIHIHSRA